MRDVSPISSRFLAWGSEKPVIFVFGILGAEIFRWEIHRDEPYSTDPRLAHDFREVVEEWGEE